MTFASFGAVAGLALTEAINTPTTMILMIVPAALFFRTLQVANKAAAAGGTCSGKGEAQRRYIKRVMIFSSAYLLAFAIQTAIFLDSEPPMALRAALGVLPALAIIGIFWAMARLIVEEQDEFIRMLIVRQSLIATGFALSAATIWGFLEAADVVVHLDAYWVAVAWFFGIFLGAVANRIQYGTWGSL
jgi:hypothetical protein